MSVVEWPSENLLPQVSLPRKWAIRLGGFREIGMQSLGYLSIPNGLMIALTYYRGADIIQSVFPTPAHWAAFYVLMGLGVAVAHYTIIYGPWQTFIQEESEQEERSPQFRETVRNGEKLDQLLAQVDQPVVVPECSKCNTPGTPGMHKGSDCITCPDCGDILHREMDL